MTKPKNLPSPPLGEEGRVRGPLRAHDARTFSPHLANSAFPLTPTLSPLGGEGVFFVIGSHRSETKKVRHVI
jgi:hypothetical protein